jgi:hypothetical protein
MILGEREESMDMILNATDHYGRTRPLLENPSLIRVQAFAVAFWNPRLTMLGAEHEMHQVLH